MDSSTLQVIRQLLLGQGDMDPFAIELQLLEMSQPNDPNPRTTFLSRQISTISKPEIEEKPPECPICLDDLFSEKATICFKNCPDIIHIECLENYLVLKISERSFPLKCPIDGCQKELHIEDVKDSLQTKPEYQMLIEQYALKWHSEVNPQDYDFCETPDCGYFFLKNPSIMRFDCLNCCRVFCKNCKENWANGHSCGVSTESQSKQKTGFSDQEFKNYADTEGYKPCPKCGRVIFRDGGCLHMTCVCGMEFCYLTGQDHQQCQCGRH